jgi:membrane peptidoglycan carboxypeptidase
MRHDRDRSLSRWRFDTLILATRLWALHGRERVTAFAARRSYYGAGQAGIEAAAEHFFCVPLTELPAADVAALVALTIAPTQLLKDRDHWAAARNRVLMRMAERGELDADVAEAARAAPLTPCTN